MSLIKNSSGIFLILTQYLYQISLQVFEQSRGRFFFINCIFNEAKSAILNEQKLR